MQYSIETRVPFLDHKLVELGLSLPNQYLADGGLGKIILRKILNNKFHSFDAYKKKQDVQTPQTIWLTTKNGSDFVKNILINNRVFLNEFIYINKAIKFIESKNYKLINNSNFIWQWISLGLWYETFFSK